MSQTTQQVPARLQEIIDDFELAEGREKLELLIQYAESLPALPAWLEKRRDRMEPVPECMTPVSVVADKKDGKLRFYFDIPPQSPTVRGFAALLSEGLGDATPEQVLQLPNDFYLQMGLQHVLTAKRLNGMEAILAHIKQIAVNELEK